MEDIILRIFHKSKFFLGIVVIYTLVISVFGRKARIVKLFQKIFSMDSMDNVYQVKLIVSDRIYIKSRHIIFCVNIYYHQNNQLFKKYKKENEQVDNNKLIPF